jgi:hypothetical protein
MVNRLFEPRTQVRRPRGADLAMIRHIAFPQPLWRLSFFQEIGH